MTEQQQVWFNNLTKDREDSAKTLEKPSMRGIKNSVVEKYSDQAHFVYELLQNANDAKATNASFQLTTAGLYFRHNGKILFSVTNPDTEDQDKANNTLGHINSITAIANSNKTESSIGKFGVGFKAVFQYTDTPYIYDPHIQFKIEKFIIPIKLENDLSDRQKDETVFYFPFNKTEMPTEKAYSDVLGKLKKLVFPTLFLSSLQELEWSAENETGGYTKENYTQKQYNDITYETIELNQKIGIDKNKERICLFSRCLDENLNYSIGFFLNKNNKLIPRQYPAFCFFPTKEVTNLNFIIHAPFLLTDSRESIKRSENHNTEMCNLLALLSADSLLILKELKLINDDIIKIIPYNEPDPDNLFAHFYDAIKEKFETEELLPGENEYVETKHAYWPEDKPVTNLFSDEQLALMIGDKKAKWVFRSLVRNQTRKDEELKEYIENCTYEWYEMSDLLQSIDADFIENQSIEWLHKLYEYLAKNNSYWGNIKTKPIFLNQEGQAVPAFEKSDKSTHEVLFLPSENLNNSKKTVHSDLLKNKKTKEFIESFGIKQPSLKDEIYNHILPLYNTDEGIDTQPHFNIFFKYWKEEGRPEDFINLIKDKEFVLYKTNDDETRYRGAANGIYYPTPDLKKYFETKPDTRFVDLEEYRSFITDKEDQLLLKEFIAKLGVREIPRILKEEITKSIVINKIKPDWGDRLYPGTPGHRGQGTFDKVIDGCRELLKGIGKEKSLILWRYLGKLELSGLEGEHRYFYYTQNIQRFEATILTQLKTKKWLLSINNELVAPNNITIEELASDYEKNPELEQLLGFKPAVVLTKAERIALKFESEEEADEAKKALEERRENEKRKAERKKLRTSIKVESEDLDDAIESLENLAESVSKSKKEKTNTLPDFDEDEELTKGIEDFKKQLETKKNRVDLADNIKKSEKYSYAWFKYYLQLLTTYVEKQNAQKQKSISFQEINPYKADNKYFLLCGASTYISPEIENADDFKVSLVFSNGKRKDITVEGVSKKGQDLLIYCRESLSNNTISRLSEIFKVEINFTPVIDLLDRLYKAFTNNNYIYEWNSIQETMPSLDFIYGPPGTGKTTSLCNRINEIIAENPESKFLVLTPTNKAADVVCKKLQDINTDIYSVRLSSPTDPDLEEYQIYRDTLDQEALLSINVVASTIHRLPYFEIKETGLLFQYNWDYVIFDESSMTGLHYITFAIMALFKTNPNTKFIVGGDPKQIPPVIEIDEKELENFDFQDENIYKMMNLESFNPKDQELGKRKIDTIQNLDKQYRSIPKIGQLFSELSYSSLLKHDRSENRKEVKLLPKKFRNLITANVTFVDIPLSQTNSIYRVNKLFYSSYHTYCAILVSEIIKHFDTTNNGGQWTIGLISPYKAQAVLLNKLITSYGISENVKVISDTVHGFQGDECDIVFFVCNPNNYFFSNHKKALLSKEYIYNVAISRAKDYLIILHPYSAIPNNYFINKIGHSYKNNFGNTKILNAHDIEETLFNNRNYIEANSYVSGHDNVNVFGLSEMKYFIKANDTAIDIQLRGFNEPQPI